MIECDNCIRSMKCKVRNAAVDCEQFRPVLTEAEGMTCEAPNCSGSVKLSTTIEDALMKCTCCWWLGRKKTKQETIDYFKKHGGVLNDGK